MVALPGLTAVTLPLASTTATCSESDFHVTFLSVASSGLTVATRVTTFPSSNSTSVLSNSTETTATFFFLTETEHVPDLPPAVAVIVAEPSPTAVTAPLLTVATAWFEVDQVTFLSVALSGATVAVRLTVPPGSRETEPWLKETLATGTVVGSIGSSFGPQEKRKNDMRTVATATFPQ